MFFLGQQGQRGEAGSTWGRCEAEGWGSCSPWRSSEAIQGGKKQNTARKIKTTKTQHDMAKMRTVKITDLIIE